jgi:hypothetical protein
MWRLAAREEVFALLVECSHDVFQQPRKTASSMLRQTGGGRRAAALQLGIACLLGKRVAWRLSLGNTDSIAIHDKVATGTANKGTSMLRLQRIEREEPSSTNGPARMHARK